MLNCVKIYARCVARSFLVLWLFIAAFVLFNNDLHGQIEMNILVQEFPHCTSDSCLITECMHKAGELGPARYDSSLYYANAALILSLRSGDSQRVIKSLEYAGYLHFSVSDYRKALETYLRIVKVSLHFRNIKSFASALNDIGRVYYYLGDYRKSLEYYQRALIVSEVIKDEKLIAFSSINIGIILMYQNNFDEALKYMNVALDKAMKTNDRITAANALLNIGTLNCRKGDCNFSLKYYFRSLKLIKGMGIREEFISLLNIAEVLTEDKRYSEAIDYYYQALSICRKNNYRDGLNYTYMGLASLYNETGRYNDAIQYASAALGIAVEIDNLEQQHDIYGILSSCYESLKQYEDAYKYKFKQKEISDSIFSLSSINQIAEMDARYRNEKKEKELEVQARKISEQQLTIERNRFWFFFLTASTLVIILISVLIVQNIRTRQKTAMQKALQEQEKLRFRAVVEAEWNERKRIAGDLHDSLGQMMATARVNIASLENESLFVDKEDYQILKTALSVLDEAFDEVRQISQNIMPSVLIRLGLVKAIKDMIDKAARASKIAFNYDFNGLDGKIPEAFEVAVYRILQEIISNILRHSFASQASITISRKENNLLISVSDNGKGFDMKAAFKSSGLGLQNILSRTTILNGKVNVDSSPSTGTEVRISFENVWES